MRSRSLNPAPLAWDARCAGVFIYDGGSQKTLTIFGAKAPKTEFFALPPNPRL